MGLLDDRCGLFGAAALRLDETSSRIVPAPSSFELGCVEVLVGDIEGPDDVVQAVLADGGAGVNVLAVQRGEVVGRSRDDEIDWVLTALVLGERDLEIGG